MNKHLSGRIINTVAPTEKQVGLAILLRDEITEHNSTEKLEQNSHCVKTWRHKLIIFPSLKKKNKSNFHFEFALFKLSILNSRCAQVQQLKKSFYTGTILESGWSGKAPLEIIHPLVLKQREGN